MATIHGFEQHAGHEDHWALPRRRVLIVDPDVDAVEAQAILLDTLGQDVRTAHDGAAALRVAIDFRPHLVLLGFDLPVVSGAEVARRLRILRPTREARIVGQFGGDCAAGSVTLPAGFDGCLLKPAPLARLMAELRATPGGPAPIAACTPMVARVPMAAEPDFFNCSVRD